MAADEKRLEHALGADRLGQLEDVRFVEVAARLRPIGLDLFDAQRDDAPPFGDRTPGDERPEPPSERRPLHHFLHLLSTAGGRLEMRRPSGRSFRGPNQAVRATKQQAC